ncbi:MAG: hypothetical protein OXL97_12470 [Chloroflexota bacterium]|nr:hypothetical protein [Chloroflexota bacterium]MDE2884813.1 hypothetical protein [Chloroflexota bacterium]
MRRTLIALAVVALAAACTSEVPEDSWVIAEPAAGDQYAITEICGLLEAEGYDISGTIGYTVGADEVGFILDELPALVRGAAEVAIGDGIRLDLQVNGLCRYTS